MLCSCFVIIALVRWLEPVDGVVLFAILIMVVYS